MSCLNVDQKFSTLKRCKNCEHVSAHMYLCSKCKLEEYCSVECQKACWPEHKKECKKSIGSEDQNLSRSIGRKVIKEILKIESFLELIYKLSKDWSNRKGYCVTCIVAKDDNPAADIGLQKIDGKDPKYFSVFIKKSVTDSDKLDQGEYKIELAYYSEITNTIEYMVNLYVKKEQVNTLSSANNLKNKPGFYKCKKNIDHSNYTDGFTIQVVI